MLFRSLPHVLGVRTATLEGPAVRRAFGCGVRWTSTSWGGKGIVRRRFGSPCWVCRCRCLGARSVPVLPCGQCPCWCSRSLACSDGNRDWETSCHAATSRRSRTPRHRGDGCGRSSARRRRGVDDLPLTGTVPDRMARRPAPRTLRESAGHRPGDQIVGCSLRTRRRGSQSPPESCSTSSWTVHSFTRSQSRMGGSVTTVVAFSTAL